MLAGFTTAGVCAYMVYAEAFLDPRPWIGYSAANAIMAVYLAFYRWRQQRKAPKEPA